MIPPIDMSDMIAEVQILFIELERHAPHEGPWNWDHPILREWMDRHGFENHGDLDPAAYYVVEQSLRRKLYSVRENSPQQMGLPIVVSPHWGAWIDPRSVEVSDAS